MNTKTTKEMGKLYRLCEALADIAFLAGATRYHSGDSREDVLNFIMWAQEFEESNRGTDWGTACHDYIEAIQAFAESKLKG